MDSPSPSSEPSPPQPSSGTWKMRMLYPTLVAGVFGAGVGLVSKHRKTHGLANICGTYAANYAIVGGFYSGAYEFIRVSRPGQPDDLLNSGISGFGTGAILGRIQAGQLGAIRYSVVGAVAATTSGYAYRKLEPALWKFYDLVTGGEIKLPEWSPIKVLDEEALAAKRAREQQIYDNIHKLQKEKP